MSRFTKLFIVTGIFMLALTACATPASEEPSTPSADLEVSGGEESAAPGETSVDEVAAPAEKEVEAPSGQITVYISPDSLGMAMEEAFEAKHGDVLNIVGGSWCRKVTSEQEAGDIQADVIYGAEPIFYMGLIKTEALMAYTSPEAVHSLPEYQWDNGYYTAADLSYIGIAYNKNLVKTEDIPAAYSDLNNAAWKQMSAVPDATQCASAYAITAAFAQPEMEMSFFESAKANGALLVDRASKVPETIAAGEAALGISPHDPVVRLQNKAKKEGVESPLAIAWPADGVYVLPRPIAIIADKNRSDDNTAIARAFVDFVLSEQGQQIIVKSGGYAPVRAGVEGPKLVSSDLKILQIDWAWAASNKPAILEAFKKTMYGN